MQLAEEEEPLLKPREQFKEKNKLKQKFLESDSSDSKYSNEDREDKDHL